MTPEKMIRYLLFHQMLNNPLPWRVERDWAYEVTASNGAIVAKCQTHEEAEEIIQMAEKINKEIFADDWPVSEATENIRDLLALSYEQGCNHPLGHSENLLVSCIRAKGHSGPHRNV